MLDDAPHIRDESDPDCDPPPESPPRHPRPSMFWPCVWLAVVMAGVKARFIAFPEAWSLAAMKAYLWNLCLLTAADILFVFALGAVGQAAIALAGRSRRLCAFTWGLLLAFCIACAAYAVASIAMFEQLRMPLTYRLLHLGRDLTNMESSLAAVATPGIIVALVAVPLGFLLVVLLTNRWFRFRRTAAGHVAQGVILIAVLMVCLVAHAKAQAIWRARHDDRPHPWRHEDRRLIASPHYVLLSSFAQEWIRGGAGDIVPLDATYRPEHLADFHPMAQSPGSREPTTGLHRGPKGVIVIVLESVGTKYLSLYGANHNTTPRLMSEAPHTLVFDNFYAHVTNTASSLIAMTLSRYPPRTWRHGTEQHPRLPGTTAAAVLKPLGYRTAFISAGDNRFARQDDFLQGRGFDDVWDYRDSDCALRKEFSWGVRDRCMVETLLKWIDRGPRDAPFYLMAWTQGTHHPYEPSPEHGIDFLPGEPAPGSLERYLNALAEMDRQLGRLFDGLRERGLDDDVIVVITGDHGEAFGDPHGNWGHTGKIYEEDVNVPLIVWSPRLFQHPARSDAIGAHVDLNPTVLDLLGLSCPPDWQGRSLFSQHRRDRAYFFGLLDSILLGVREGDHKYIYDVTSGHERLFNVKIDPQEQQNIAHRHPEHSQRLRQRLSAWTSSEGSP